LPAIVSSDGPFLSFSVLLIFRFRLASLMLETKLRLLDTPRLSVPPRSCSSWIVLFLIGIAWFPAPNVYSAGCMHETTASLDWHRSPQIWPDNVCARSMRGTVCFAIQAKQLAGCFEMRFQNKAHVVKCSCEMFFILKGDFEIFKTEMLLELVRYDLGLIIFKTEHTCKETRAA